MYDNNGSPLFITDPTITRNNNFLMVYFLSFYFIDCPKITRGHLVIFFLVFCGTEDKCKVAETTVPLYERGC